LITRAAGAFGAREFVSWKGQSFSYATINREANRFAHGLRALGVTHGTRVGILCGNCPEFLFAWFGLAKLGAIQVPLNTGYKAPQIRAVLRRSETSVVILQASLAVDRAIANECISACKQIVIVGGEVGVLRSPGAVAFDDVVKNARTDEPDCEVLPTDITAIMNTSGTSGPAKGVMLPHGQQYWLARNMVRALHLSSEDVFYNFFPFFHNTAQAMITLPVLLTGGRMVMTEKFSVSAFWPDVKAHGVTVFYYIGEILHLLAEAAGPADISGARFRAGWGIGGAPRDVARFEDRYKVQLGTGYGSTEGNVPVFRALGSDPSSAAAGKVLPEFEVCIADPTGKKMPNGQLGEILIKCHEPASLMLGYDNSPDATADAFRDGWYHSGDAGYLDDTGDLYFVSRIKDVIRVRGENISPFEVEEVILSYPGILEAAAIAVPSEIGGDDVKIVIVPTHDAQIDLVDLLDHCAKLLPKYSMPRYIELRDALPKTATNKIQKNLLRERPFGPQTWDATKKAYLDELWLHQY